MNSSHLESPVKHAYLFRQTTFLMFKRELQPFDVTAVVQRSAVHSETQASSTSCLELCKICIYDLYI